MTYGSTNSAKKRDEKSGGDAGERVDGVEGRPEKKETTHRYNFNNAFISTIFILNHAIFSFPPFYHLLAFFDV